MPINQASKMKVEEIITDRILTALENGTVPWEKPWDDEVGCPVNLISKRAYSGINIWLLALASMSGGYSSPYWVSFKQAKDLGGHVREGEKGTIVCFAKKVEASKKAKKADPDAKPFFMLRYYRVWNVEQCEGFENKIPEPEARPPFDPCDAAEAILSAYKGAPKVKHGGTIAAYAPAFDEVYMPNRETFRSSPDYYSVHFHEFVHSTGHESRLKRKGIENFDGFGSHQYSEEELIAEFGAAFLCGTAGIVGRTIDNSAAYINTWKSKIAADPKLVIRAARAAQKATDYILGTGEKTESEVNNEV